MHFILEIGLFILDAPWECGILIGPEMQPASPVVEAQIPYHWTDREVLDIEI